MHTFGLISTKLAQEVAGKTVIASWVSWKSTHWKPYFTYGVHNVHISIVRFEWSSV